jgi:hypothetical protein
VHLVEKAYFVVARVAGLLVGDRTTAAILYGAGFDREPWQAFLESANDLMRTRRGPAEPVDAFFRTVEALRPDRHDQVSGAVERIRLGRPNAESFREGLFDDPQAIPVLDMLSPAIVRSVVHWGRSGAAVAIIHDEHSTLTEHRVARLRELSGGPDRLASLRLVDSRADPRVQVADIVAGVARKIASDELGGRGDPELTGLLPPYVDPHSVWGDEPSWSRLAGGVRACAASLQ